MILDPVGAHLEPGEILVAPSTDPGWTPLFMTAGALVMEMGGVISHGAVVAREYGIPAVVGVPDATTRLRTGQTVTVDGSAGTVTVDAPRRCRHVTRDGRRDGRTAADLVSAPIHDGDSTRVPDASGARRALLRAGERVYVKSMVSLGRNARGRPGAGPRGVRLRTGR